MELIYIAHSCHQLLILNCFATQNGCLYPSAEGKLNLSHRYYKIVDIGYPECGVSISTRKNTILLIMRQLEDCFQDSFTPNFLPERLILNV